MSATVETDYVYYASCSECGTGSATCEDEDDAAEWAANHNAENHEPDDGEDEKYEQFKDSRGN